MIFFCLKN